MKLTVTLATPEKLIYNGEADSLVIPGQDGYFGVLPNHAAMISALSIGELKIKNNNQEYYYAIDGGFSEINKNRVIILTSSAQSADEIDDSTVRDVLQKSTERLHSKLEDKELLQTHIAIRKATVQLEVSRHKIRR
ncbi:MAG: ATP synthase F1 subunit epsilon [bacterium]